jgi:hypothetical protein
LPFRLSHPIPHLLLSFWANKGAVAATFTIISLVTFGIFFAAITTVIRRRNLKKRSLDEYFEKYNENSARGGDFADDVSTDLPISPAGADAYPDRQIHYGHDADTYPNDDYSQGHDTYSQGHHQQDVTNVYAPDDYSANYPPGVAYSTSQEEQYQYHSGQGQHAQTESPFPKEDGTGLAPPVAFRDPIGREQGGRDSYQTSIDSFYGAYAR